MNILIVKLSAIGDVIHTLPALNAIRMHYPNAHITWAVEEAASPLLEGHPALDRILISRRKRWIRGLRSPSRRTHIRAMRDFIKALRDTQYDLVFDFQQLLKSGVLVGLSRGRRKIGYDQGMAHMEHSYLFLNERMRPVKMDNHALLRSLMLLEAVGIPRGEIVYKVPIQNKDREAVDALLSDHGLGDAGLLIPINPMTKWATKLWSGRKFADLADRLIRQHSARVIFTGGPEDREALQHIMADMAEDAVNLAGKTSLRMLAALYEKSDFLVSTDTGPMHLAAAVGKPVVAIFGPTAPWRTGPFGEGHQVIRAGMECSPCLKRQCPTMECMERVTVEDVLEGVRKVIARLSGEASGYLQITPQNAKDLRGLASV